LRLGPLTGLLKHYGLRDRIIGWRLRLQIKIAAWIRAQRLPTRIA
jgi:hypothetical protein